jgi:outer membrane lipoprotein carrier protein
VESLIDKFAKIKSLKANFFQETTIKGFGTDGYTGKIRLIAKEKILWDYTSPYPQYYLFTKDTMEYYDSSTEQLIRQKVASSGANNIVFQILIDLKEAKNTFNFEMVEQNKIKLIPKTEIGLKFLIIEFSDIYISKIFSEDNNGNVTEITLMDVKINEKIDDSEFKKEVPLNTEIFNY